MEVFTTCTETVIKTDCVLKENVCEQCSWKKKIQSLKHTFPSLRIKRSTGKNYILSSIPIARGQKPGCRHVKVNFLHAV